MAFLKKNIFVLLLAAFFSVSGEASAADLTDSVESFEGLLDLIQQSANGWDARLRGYAQTVFMLLATIQFIWLFFPLVFKQADFGEIVGELIRFIIVIGFFYALLLLSVEWGTKIIDSFREAGGAAAGTGKPMRPGDIFGLAVELAVTIGDVKTINPLTAFMVSLAGVLVLLCFAFIAAFMALTIVESYIVINASVLFMGFGASQWTREFALAIARYSVAVGAKLFVLTLLVGLIMTASTSWQAAYNHNSASMWTMVGLAFTCAYLAKTIPELIGGLISGSSGGGGSSIGGMAAAVAAAGAAVATAGAAAALGSAAAAAGTGAGTGGLANTINSAMQAGSSAPGAAATGAGSAATTGSNLGGASAAKSAASGQQASSAGQKTGGSSAPKPNTNAQGQEKNEDQKSNQTSNEKSGQGAGESGGFSKTALASGAVRATGILSAISVPGMESATGLSLNVPPSNPEDIGEIQGGDMAPDSVEDVQNTIRPASAPPEETGPAPKEGG